MISLYEQKAEVEFNLESAKQKVDSLTKDLEWLDRMIRGEKDEPAGNASGEEEHHTRRHRKTKA